MLHLQIPITETEAYELNLDQAKIKVGRNPDNDIRIVDDSISGVHAVFSRNDSGEYFLIDHASRNGTFLNGKRIRSRSKVTKGDQLTFGPISCLVREALGQPVPVLAEPVPIPPPVEEPESEPVIDFDDVIEDLVADALPSEETTAIPLFQTPESLLDLPPIEPERIHGSFASHSVPRIDWDEIHRRESENRMVYVPPKVVEPSQDEVIHELGEKLEKTREGFSFALRTAGSKLEESQEREGDLKNELERAYAEIDRLEEESTKLRNDLLLAEAKNYSASTLEDEIRAIIPALESASPENRRVAQDAESALQNLVALENRVNHLKNLELELSNKINNHEKIAFSRKGVFSEDPNQNADAEQSLCKELVQWLEDFDNQLNYYQQNWLYPKVSSQLAVLRKNFIELLKDRSVVSFAFDEGAELTFEARSRIQLIHVDDSDDAKLKRVAQRIEESDQSTILGTVRPGYVYKKGDEEIILRKAEVVVA